MSDAQWTYEVEGTEYGPVSTQILKSLLQSGELDASTMCRSTAMDQWAKASSIEELTQDAAAPAVAPPLIPPVPAPNALAIDKEKRADRERIRQEGALRRAQERPMPATMAALLALLGGGIALLIGLQLRKAIALLRNIHPWETGLPPGELEEVLNNASLLANGSIVLGAASVLAGVLVYVGAARCRIALITSSLLLAGMCAFIVFGMDREAVSTTLVSLTFFLLLTSLSAVLCMRSKEIDRWLEAKKGNLVETPGSPARPRGRRPRR